MAPHREDTEEAPPAETSQQPGDRLQKEQQKELASLDQEDAPNTEMDEKVRQPFMLKLNTLFPCSWPVFSAYVSYTCIIAACRMLKYVLVQLLARVESP